MAEQKKNRLVEIFTKDYKYEGIVLLVLSIIAIIVLRRKSDGYVSDVIIETPKETVDDTDYEKQFNIDPEDIKLSEQDVIAKEFYDAIDKMGEKENEDN